MSTQLLMIHALSPLHAGTGQSFGAIDLTIARERSTRLPYLPGSSLKGSLRDVAREHLDTPQIRAVFGPDTENASDHAGCMAFGDGRLLLMPARSMAGTFAWVTSPLVLARYARDAQGCGMTHLPAIPQVPSPVECFAGDALRLQERVYFEDFEFTPNGGAQLRGWAAHLSAQLFEDEAFWTEHLNTHLCIVHDDVFAFLGQFATEVVTRNKLDPKKKTVVKGQLWDEENLPAESVLYSVVVATPNRAAEKVLGQEVKGDDLFGLLTKTTAHPVQLGGKASVGRGRCRLTLRGASS